MEISNEHQPFGKKREKKALLMRIDFDRMAIELI